MKSPNLTAFHVLILGLGCTLVALGSPNVPAMAKFYLSARANANGAGPASSALDVSTADKFDAFFAARLKAHTPAEIHLSAGTYNSAVGLTPWSGLHLLGSGQDQTFIKVHSNASGPTNCGYGTAVIGMNGPAALNDVVIRDLTLDNGADAYSTHLSAPFTMPGTGAGHNQTTLSVPNAAHLQVGDSYYIQDAPDSVGTKLWYGPVLINSVVGNRVVVSNTGGNGGEVPVAGTIVPASASLYPFERANDKVGVFAARPGLMIAGNHIRIENVTVQNVSMPYYEGPAGINFGKQSAETQTGNVVSHCTVRDVYGQYPWYLSCDNEAANFTQCDFTDNVVQGNGYYHGVNGWCMAGCHFTNNRFFNVQAGFFCDSIDNKNDHFTRNLVVGSPLANSFLVSVQGSAEKGGFHDSEFSDNVLICNSPSAGGVGIGALAARNLISHNRIFGIGGIGLGIGLTTIANTGKGNRYEFNQIDHTFKNEILVSNTAVGSQLNNTDDDGKPLSVIIPNPPGGAASAPARH